jgi:hypothetical protein
MRVSWNGQIASTTDMNGFLLELIKQLAKTPIPGRSAQSLAGIVGELVNNVREHAGTPDKAIAAFEMDAKGVWLAVADTGQGVLAGYTTGVCGVAPMPADAQEALEWAVLKHRSRTGDPSRGLGFRDVQLALRSLDATVRVRSDQASLEVVGTGDAAEWLLREQVQLRGFVVSVHVSWSL